MNTGTVIVLAISIPLSAGQEVSHVNECGNSSQKENHLEYFSYFVPTNHSNLVLTFAALPGHPDPVHTEAFRARIMRSIHARPIVPL